MSNFREKKRFSIFVAEEGGRGENKKKEALFSKNIRFFCVFFGCGARHSRLRPPVGSAPAKDMVSQIRGRKPSQQGVFLFQVELAGQNVICDEKESGQEKEFHNDAQ